MLSHTAGLTDLDICKEDSDFTSKVERSRTRILTINTVEISNLIYTYIYNIYWNIKWHMIIMWLWYIMCFHPANCLMWVWNLNRKRKCGYYFNKISKMKNSHHMYICHVSHLKLLNWLSKSCVLERQITEISIITLGHRRYPVFEGNW